MHARNAADREHEDEADRPKHWRLKESEPSHIVAAVKYIFVFTKSPAVYMWCAHTMKPTTPIATIA